MTKLANQWAAANGAAIKVVNKGTDPGVIRSGLSTVAASDAPDIIVGAHDWTGEFVNNGVVAPIQLGDKSDEFALSAVQAFTYDGQVYGAPYAIRRTPSRASAAATAPNALTTGGPAADVSRLSNSSSRSRPK